MFYRCTVTHLHCCSYTRTCQDVKYRLTKVFPPPLSVIIMNDVGPLISNISYAAFLSLLYISRFLVIKMEREIMVSVVLA